MRHLVFKLLSFLVIFSFTGGLFTACDAETDTAGESQPAAAENVPADENPNLSTVSPAKTSDNVYKWTVLLYQDADDEILEEDIFTDLNEAELVGSSDEVAIVSQIDRYKGGFKGDGNWKGAKRFFVTQDDDLEHLNSEEVQDLGEVNMADSQTLIDFVDWGVKNYPADKYVLILSDHGSGWPGGFSDGDSKSDSKNELIDGFGDMIYLSEFDDALAEIQNQTGVKQFELIGMDACLMGQLEVLSVLQPYAHYAVLSQETEPGLGWAYAGFLKQLVAKPDDMDGSTLAKKIVSTYINEDTIIVDDERRASYVEEYYDTSDELSAAEVVREESKPITLAAYDLTKVPALLSSLDELAQAMSDINQKVVARARSHTQSFESVYGDDEPSPYIDLGHFAKLIKNESTSPKVSGASDKVRAAIKDTVIQERHGSDKKGASGVTIYFPNSNLFKGDGTDYNTYINVADRFSRESLWPGFLNFHYTGQPLQQNSQPVSADEVSGPGAEKLTMDDISLSDDSIKMDEVTTLTSYVHGENLAYLYLFTGYIDDESGAIQVLDIDYIDSDDTRDVDGVVYPDWGEDRPVEVEIDWYPVQFAISNGKTTAAALLEPQVYAADLENTIYTTDAIYTFADSGSQHYARLYFNGDGKLTRIVGFSGMTDTGPQREISPQKGDSLTLLQRWIEENDKGEVEINHYEGETIKIGSKPITWEEIDAPSGAYVVGLLAEDMDGNEYSSYVDVAVK
ncbi:MAG: clostripain-related cysteine peptidase [Anaerolineae bacterium]|nr:clostripain-related cysteine peptidase [Anaerolineae bacterium]